MVISIDGKISYIVHLEEIEPQIQGCQNDNLSKVCRGPTVCGVFYYSFFHPLSFNLKVIMIIFVGIKSPVLKIKKLRLRKIEHFEVTQLPTYRVRN